MCNFAKRQFLPNPRCFLQASPKKPFQSRVRWRHKPLDGILPKASAARFSAVAGPDILRFDQAAGSHLTSCASDSTRRRHPAGLLPGTDRLPSRHSRCRRFACRKAASPGPMAQYWRRFFKENAAGRCPPEGAIPWPVSDLHPASGADRPADRTAAVPSPAA